jgi:hypothetical protein
MVRTKGSVPHHGGSLTLRNIKNKPRLRDLGGNKKTEDYE